MKIAWISNFNTSQHQGGAQQTIKAFSDFIITKEYKVIGFNKDTLDLKKITECDFAIISNINQLNFDKLNEIIYKIPYIKFEHDSDTPLVLEKIPKIYQNAKAIFFLSNLHKDTILGKVKRIKNDNIFIQPPFIDPEKFKKMPDIIREPDSILWAGAFAWFKGIRNFIKYIKQYPQKHYYLAGLYLKTKDKEYLKALKELKQLNVKILGEIDFSLMPNLYNRMEAFYHCPDGIFIEAFGRTVMEAYLCGCRLIVDEKYIGAFSCGFDFGNYDSVVAKCKQIPEDFYNKLTEIIE